MKKLIAMLLVLATVLSLAACGAKAPAASSDVAMQYIKAEEAKELLENDEYVFFDIRKAADSSANSIPGAEAWDMDAAKNGDAEAGKATMTEATKGLDKKIILVCYSGKRYAQAATNALSAIGYDMSKVFTLEGGFTNWSETYTELTTAGEVYVAPTEAEKVEQPEYEAITDLRLSGGAPSTFNILNTETSNDRVFLINLVEGLCDNNNKGQMIPAVAKEWGTKDGGKTWTFTLRDNAKWVDINGNEKANVTAYDWATGMEWILNFHKNSNFNTANLVQNIAGAQEYLDYTKSLEASEALALTWGEGSKFAEMVGIETPDAYTIIYTCIKETPYFDSLTTTSSLYPLAQGLIDEVGVENVNAVTNETMWYNSCYTMTTYEHGGEIILEKNPLYWDTDCTLFNTVTYVTVESKDMAYMLYENGELDMISLGQSQIQAIMEDPNHPFYDYVVPGLPGRTSNHMQLNYDKNFPDGTKDVQWNTAVANEAFRKAMYYGIDFTDYFKCFNSVDPMACTNDFITRSGVSYTSNGEDYVELVRANLGMDAASKDKIAHLDADKAAKYLDQAKKELADAGLTFPIVIEYYTDNNQGALDNAAVLKQCIEDAMGTDFVEVKIGTYVKLADVRDAATQAFAIFGYGGVVADPSTYLRHYLYDNTAWWTNKYLHTVNLPEDSEIVAIVKEFTDLYNKANAIVDDNDARMAAFAEAEALLQEHAITIPCYITNGLQLTRVDPNSLMISQLAGMDNKMKNWVTNVDGFTREIIEANAN